MKVYNGDADDRNWIKHWKNRSITDASKLAGRFSLVDIFMFLAARSVQFGYLFSRNKITRWRGLLFLWCPIGTGLNILKAIAQSTQQKKSLRLSNHHFWTESPLES